MENNFSKSSKPAFQTFEDVQAHLDSLGLFHMDLKLDRIQRAIKLLNLRPLCPVVQVVGTNGKGSSSTFLHSIALANGFRVGLFTSPHFISPSERIRMNDRQLPKEAWVTLANQVLAVASDLTYFELITVISLLAFSLSEPDLLIYEAGLGGKHDASTAFHADLLCITPIDLDHTEYLGNTLQEIATDKSYAIRENMFAVVSAPQQKEAWTVIEQRAKSLDIPLYHEANLNLLPEHAHINCAKTHYKNLGLKGEHQEMNAQTAVIAWQLLCQQFKCNFTPEAVAKGLEDAFIPGRFQYVMPQENLPTLILDGAHNVHSMKSLIATLEQEHIQPSALIFSCLEDKNPELLVELLETYFLKHNLQIPVILLQIPHNARAIKPTQLANLFKNKTHICENMREALDFLSKTIAEKDMHKPSIICGSLYLLGEYYTLFPNNLQQST